MLSGEGSENGENTTIGLISKQKQLYTCSTLLCPFLCRCFARLPGYTIYGGNVVRVFSFFFFFIIVFFTLVAANIAHFLTTATKFHVVPPTKNVSFVFSLQLKLFFSGVEFAGLSPYFLFFSVFNSLSLYSTFADMTINLSLILQTTRIRKHFPLSVLVFIDSLVASASQDVGGHTLSRQNNLKFGIGLHAVGARTVGVRTLRHKQIFLLSQVLQIYLSNGVPPRARTFRHYRVWNILQKTKTG